MRQIYSTRNLVKEPKLPAQQAPANNSLADSDGDADQPASKRLASLLSAKFGKSAASSGLSAKKQKQKKGMGAVPGVTA